MSFSAPHAPKRLDIPTHVQLNSPTTNFVVPSWSPSHGMKSALGELGRVRGEKRRVVVSADRAEPAAVGFLPYDLKQRVGHHQHSHFALGDARQQALVDDVADVAAAEVSPGKVRPPRPRLGRRPVDAKL
eukprot:31482-Pelagococcus_subviridis.AAC.7